MNPVWLAESPARLVDESDEGLTTRGKVGLLWLVYASRRSADSQSQTWDGMVQSPISDLAIYLARDGDEIEAFAVGKAPGLVKRAREVFGELLAAGKFVEVETEDAQ